MSKDWDVSQGDAWEQFCVMIETETDDGDRGICEERFFGYCKEEVNTALRYLSLHSADIDARMICINSDLYWSIIWYYGSITKALKEAGGQRLYEIGFGKHKVDSSWEDLHDEDAESDDECSLLFLYPSITISLVTDHFVSKLTNKKMEWRYRCSNPGCCNLEDTEKFLSCNGCVKYSPRKYCGQECYEEDWEKHKEHCQSQREENNNKTKEPAWKQSQQKKKARGKKKY